MRKFIRSFGLAMPFAAIVSAASADSESVAYNFPNMSLPEGRLLQDKSGALYATTYHGGSNQLGSVIELKQARGKWKAEVIYEFAGGSSDGANPAGGVSEDANGVLYGTTVFGGKYGNGTVYSLTQSGGIWSESVLQSFDGSDGGHPNTAMTSQSASGDFYGTTSSGGSQGCGTAFQLHNSNGQWSLKTIYEFQGGSDGCSPGTALRAGPKTGTYYGATTYGGRGHGTFYQLQETRGKWTESVLYAFTGGRGGGNPSDVDADKQLNGALYGVTWNGGPYKQGVVFELQKSHGKWNESVKYSFQGGAADGSIPTGLKYDATSGDFFGVTQNGGSENAGTVFVLTPNGNSWTESLLHSFGGTGDGIDPPVRPIQDFATNALFGITGYGGAYGGGTVWTIPVTAHQGVRRPAK